MNSNTIKERPILFSAPMVRAILDGRKTQTRRIAEISEPFDYPQFNAKVVNFRKKTYWFDCQKSHPEHIANACPYGTLADRLWIRETWAPANSDDGPVILYRADGDRRYLMNEDKFLDEEGAFSYEITGKVYFDSWASDIESADMGWKSSIHMPRWASRINLEITDVRVEKLQDISDVDAIAEGIQADFLEHIHGPAGYRDLWESINGQGSWDKNPWVWVIEFKRIDMGVSA